MDKKFEDFLVVRPLLTNREYDKNDIPIIRKTPLEKVDFEKLRFIGVQNLRKTTVNKDFLVHMFIRDKRLESIWNNPLKKIPLFQGCTAVASPDFSIYPGMNKNIIKYNLFRSRWLGCIWQDYGCTVFPTVMWGDDEDYDLYFDSIEKESVVVVSTLGCTNFSESQQVFINGFNEMKKRINPPLIIVYGEMIKGMKGRFINFKFEDAFSTKCIQQRIPGISQTFEIL